jgi:hypothetical protein
LKKLIFRNPQMDVDALTATGLTTTTHHTLKVLVEPGALPAEVLTEPE